MSQSSKQRYIPGKGFIKNFFKVHGPIKTLKGSFFYYYSQFRLSRLSIDTKTSHTVQLNGYSMSIIPTDKGISAELLMFKTHEPLCTNLLASELREGMVCLDIGSNIGYYAVLESRMVGKDGSVICIEPSASNFEYLRRNVHHEAKGEVKLYNIAVGDHNGEIPFLIGKQSNLCRPAEPGEESAIPKDHELIRVPVKTVDSLMDEIALKNLDLVRMDPEGYEARIYKGMKSTVSKYKPMLLIEFHRNFLGLEGTRNLLNGLRDDGYECLYYVARWMDNPIIATKKYVEKISIMHLLEKVEKDSLPAGFTLLLINTNKNK